MDHQISKSRRRSTERFKTPPQEALKKSPRSFTGSVNAATVSADGSPAVLQPLHFRWQPEMKEDGPVRTAGHICTTCVAHMRDSTYLYFCVCDVGSWESKALTFPLRTKNRHAGHGDKEDRNVADADSNTPSPKGSSVYKPGDRARFLFQWTAPTRRPRLGPLTHTASPIRLG